jgi:outer membrane protein TolC
MQLNPNRSLAGLTLFVVVMFLQIEFPAAAAAQDNAPMELTLSQAIDHALKQNRSLKLAQLAVVDSEQKKKIARADYFPQIKNESTAFHVTELQQLVIPEGSLGVGAVTGADPAQDRSHRTRNSNSLHQRHRTATTFDADVQDPPRKPRRHG